VDFERVRSDGTDLPVPSAAPATPHAQTPFGWLTSLERGAREGEEGEGGEGEEGVPTLLLHSVPLVAVQTEGPLRRAAGRVPAGASPPSSQGGSPGETREGQGTLSLITQLQSAQAKPLLRLEFSSSWYQLDRGGWCT